MEEKMEYMIIVGTGLLDLATNVNTFCEFGWEPQGGIFLDPRSKLYCQPAVKELNDGPKEN
jgi:hypothetical protein